MWSWRRTRTKVSWKKIILVKWFWKWNLKSSKRFLFIFSLKNKEHTWIYEKKMFLLLNLQSYFPRAHLICSLSMRARIDFHKSWMRLMFSFSHLFEIFGKLFNALSENINHPENSHIWRNLRYRIFSRGKVCAKLFSW